MKFPSKEIVAMLKKQYPIGSRVELVRMDDFQAPPIGTLGTVKGVDDTGSILVSWDNGCGLNVVYGEDECRNLDAVKTTGKVTETIKEQILIIRDTGLTNMFDVHMVQRLANELGFYDLVIFIEEHCKEYSQFIIYGDE